MVQLTVFIYFLYTPGGVTLSTGRVTRLLHLRKCLLGSVAFTQGKCHIFCPRIPRKALSGGQVFFFFLTSVVNIKDPFCLKNTSLPYTVR